MKKTILFLCMALVLVLCCSCSETIETDPGEANGLGPLDRVSAPTSPSSIPEVDTSGISAGQFSDPTDPSSDVSKPTDSNISFDPSGATTSPDPNEDENEQLALTTPVSGYPSNKVYSKDGDQIDTSVSGNTRIYRVKYAETLSMIVEVTPTDGGNVVVDLYLEHYALSMNPGKPIEIAIGSHSATALSPKVEWENNTPARTLLMSASASADQADSVTVSVTMPYGGSYHGETIDVMSFTETVFLK